MPFHLPIADFDIPNATFRSTVYRLYANVQVTSGTSPREIYESAVETSLDWLATKVHFPIPKEEGRRKGFRIFRHEPDSFRVCCSSDPEDACFAAVMILGAKTSEQVLIPARRWIINLALRQIGAEVLFGISAICSYVPAVEGDEAPYPRYFPELVTEMIRRYGLFDIRPIDGKPWDLESEDDLYRLHEYLHSKKRTLSILVLTQSGREQGTFVYDEQLLSQHALGYAHVVCLPPALEERWAVIIGREWSVPPDSYRIYDPEVDFRKTPKIFPSISITIDSDTKHCEADYNDSLNRLVGHLKECMRRSEQWDRLYKYPKARFRKARKERMRIQREIKDLPARLDTMNDSSKQDLQELRVCIQKLNEAFMEENAALKGLIYETKVDKADMQLSYEYDRENLICLCNCEKIRNRKLCDAIEAERRWQLDVLATLDSIYPRDEKLEIFSNGILNNERIAVND